MRCAGLRCTGRNRERPLIAKSKQSTHVRSAERAGVARNKCGRSPFSPAHKNGGEQRWWMKRTFVRLCDSGASDQWRHYDVGHSKFESCTNHESPHHSTTRGCGGCGGCGVWLQLAVLQLRCMYVCMLRCGCAVLITRDLLRTVVLVSCFFSRLLSHQVCVRSFLSPSPAHAFASRFIKQNKH